MNELYTLRCHMYYSQYLTVACVEFQTFIPLKFLLILTANFCYNWSMEYLLEITISQGYICKRSCQHNAEILFYESLVSILKLKIIISLTCRVIFWKSQLHSGNLQIIHQSSDAKHLSRSYSKKPHLSQ